MSLDEPIRKAAEAVADRMNSDWRQLEAETPDRESQRLLHLLRAIDAIGKVNEHATTLGTGAGAATEASAALDAAGTRARDAEGRLPGAVARWGQLELLERVGVGAFGEVYRAWDARLEREVALKLLHRPGNRRSTGTLAVDEGRLLARVRHPNVVSVFGADVVDGEVGLWMEFVRGQTLAQAVAAEGSFDAETAVRIGIDVCRALSAVHAAGLLHRDVKAQNVMLDETGRTVLMDFGTVHDVAPQADSAGGGGVTGTPLYLAPEVLAGHAGTVTSDIYAIGVLLYHVVTGSYPVRADTIEALRQAHELGQHERLSDARPDLPRAFVGVVEKALAKDPARRYDSAAAMEVALVQASRTTRSLFRGRALVTAVLAACLVGGLLLVLTWRTEMLPIRSRESTKPRVTPVSAPALRQIPDGHVFIATGPITPDGRLLPGLAYPTRALAVMEVATGEVKRLTPETPPDGGEMNGMAIFSPRGDRIAYVWQAGDQMEVRVAHADGEDVRTIYRHEIGLLAGWTPDGSSVIVVRPGEGTKTAVEKLDVATGAHTPLLELPYRGPTAAEISPDGRYFLYDGPPRADVAARDIYIADLASGRTSPAVTGPANDTFPVWLRDGRGFLFASNRSGANGLWLQEVKDGRASGAPRLLAGHIGRVKPPVSVSSSGEFYYRQQTGLVDVFVAPIDLRVSRVGPAAVVQARQVGGHLFPDWSSDSRTLLFSWRREDSIDFDYKSASMVLHRVAEGTEREVTPDTSRVGFPRVSPDGRYAVIRGTKDPTAGLCLVELATGATRLLLAGDELGPAEWTRDGRALLFVAGPTIRELDVATLRQREVCRAPAGMGIDPVMVVSPSGRLAFLEGANEGRQRLVLRVLTAGKAGRALDVPTANGRTQLAGWTPDEREVLAVRSTGKGGELIWLPIGGGAPRTTDLVAEDGMRDARVSPDGHWLAYTAGWPTVTQWVIEHVVPAR